MSKILIINTFQFTLVGIVWLRFGYKDYRDESRNKEMTLNGEELIRRYSMHVLPERFVRIRHFGYLAPGNRELLGVLQMALGQTPVPRHRKRKSWQTICSVRGHVMNICPECGSGILVFERTLPRIRSPDFNDASRTA